jgi:hypothetical protein
VRQVEPGDDLAQPRFDLGLLVLVGPVGEREVGQVARQADAGRDNDIRLRARGTEPFADVGQEGVKVHPGFPSLG